MAVPVLTHNGKPHGGVLQGRGNDNFFSGASDGYVVVVVGSLVPWAACSLAGEGELFDAANARFRSWPAAWTMERFGERPRRQLGGACQDAENNANLPWQLVSESDSQICSAQESSRVAYDDTIKRRK